MILLALTVVTVWVAQVDFGFMNVIIAMGIATIKAGLVLAYFMHLKYDDRLYLALVLTSVGFLFLLWGISQLDIVTRVLETSVL